MIDLYKACSESVGQLEHIHMDCGEEIERINKTVSSMKSIYVYANHPFNYLLPFLYGGTSCLISSSEEVNDFLKKIHDDYAHDKGIVGTILGHKGDLIDKMPSSDGKTTIFIDRLGNEKDFGMHRLFWGHDIFSIHKDNPFVLLSKQYGFIEGIIKAFRHLVVDTFSSQGLPIPFHSWFDYTIKNGDKLEVKNALLEFARKTAADAKGSGASAVEVNKAFSHIFTVKAADIATTGLNSALCATHNYIMNKDDLTAASQVRLIAYSTQFFGKAMYGAIKTGGVPFISWPTAMAVLKELYVFTKSNLADVSRLERKTSELRDKNLQIERQIFGFGALLPSYSSAEDYIKEVHQIERGLGNLMTRFATSRRN